MHIKPARGQYAEWTIAYRPKELVFMKVYFHNEFFLSRQQGQKNPMGGMPKL